MNSTGHCWRRPRRTSRVLLACLVVVLGCGQAENSLLLLDQLPDVESINITGNKAFSEGELKKLMALREGTWWNPFREHKYREAQLQTDLNAITTHYLRHGYQRIQILNYSVRESQGDVTIDIVLSEGDAFTVKDVSLRGVPSDLQKDVQKNLGLKPGKAFDPFRLTEDRQVIANLLADHGYWQAKVDASVQFFGTHGLVFYNVEAGDRYVLRNLTVSGNERLKDSAVQRDIVAREGRVLERKDLLRSQTLLLESGYYYDARWDTSGLDTVAHRIDVDFSVRERRVHWIEGGVGISSTSQLRLSSEWGTRNFLGTGVRFAINNRTDIDLAGNVPGALDEHRTDLIWNMRGLFGTSWEGQPNTFFRYDKVDPTGEPPSYSQSFVGVGFSARRKLGDLRNQLVFSFDNQWIWNNADSAAQAFDPFLARETYTQRLLSGWIERDTRNSFFDPTRGVYLYDLAQVGWGGLGGSGGFSKLDGTLIHVKTLRLPVRTVVLAGRIQAGYIWPLSSDTLVAGQPIRNEAELVPTQDRFLLGGGSTVRGYEQDELNGIAEGDSTVGGLTKIMANVELRTPLFWRFGLVGFLDIGNVWTDPNDLDLGDFLPHFDRSNVESDDIRYTYGLGLRFATPVGPLRIDYAWKWNFPQQPAGEQEIRRSRWHVGIGQAF